MKHQTAWKYIREAGFEVVTYEGMWRSNMIAKVLEKEIRVLFYGSNGINRFEVRGLNSEQQKIAGNKLRDFLSTKGYKTNLEIYQNDFNKSDTYYILYVTNLEELGEVKPRKHKIKNA